MRAGLNVRSGGVMRQMVFKKKRSGRRLASKYLPLTREKKG